MAHAPDMRALVVMVAACASPSPRTVSNHASTPAPASPWPAWDAVVPGATFVLASATTTIVGTVTAVNDRADHRVIHLAWMRNGVPLEAATRELTLPDTITLGPTTVVFDGMGGGNGEFPVAVTPTEQDAPWARNYGAALCYGDGPHTPVACDDDLCGFNGFCVEPKRGLVGGWGEWWPDGEKFEPKPN